MLTMRPSDWAVKSQPPAICQVVAKTKNNVYCCLVIKSFVRYWNELYAIPFFRRESKSSNSAIPPPEASGGIWGVAIACFLW